MSKTKFNHKWFWLSKLPERKGQKCRVLARGKMNSILVEFEDGYKVITSRYAVRLITTLLIVLLITQGCISTVITTDPTLTAPPAAGTPLPADGSTSPEPSENAAGAVFIIPNYWTHPTPATAEPKKGRSNYQ